MVDRTSVSMNGVRMDNTQRLYARIFADYFVISRWGRNAPWKIVCSSVPYVLSALTDMTVPAWGRHTVYYGKMFFIVASDRITVTWSEEADPDLGYRTGRIAIRGRFGETSPEGLEAIEGTNVALYVFRENSTTAITGAVNTDFAAVRTQDAIKISRREHEALMPWCRWAIPCSSWIRSVVPM